MSITKIIKNFEELTVHSIQKSTKVYKSVINGRINYFSIPDLSLRINSTKRHLADYKKFHKLIGVYSKDNNWILVEMAM